MRKECLDILFLGDIVGRPGRQIVAKYLNELKNSPNQPDFIIANVENASHGFGLTERNYNELINLNIGALTSGNHIWDKKEIFDYIDRADHLVRPLNYPKGVPGQGSKIFNINGISIGVINLLGRIFMAPMDSPWELLEEEVKKLQYETSIIIVDFHAEATAEKLSFAYFADKLGVSAVIGTHTHVQTADEQIMEHGMGYISDAGFCGASDGVIGMDKESSLKRLLTGLPERFDVAPGGKTELNAIRMLINKSSGCTEKIDRIKYFTEVSEDK
jgi:metallophosphoesterase (TIGR00282 family)